MSYPFDWLTIRENGVAVSSSPISPISEGRSLLMFSDGSEWDVTDPGLRKSANVAVNPVLHERGFEDGRIRTFIRRNNATSQARAWGGVFILSDDEDGIGTRVDPGQNRYEISDQDGFITLTKFTDALPEVLFVSVATFDPTIIYGFQVLWNYDSLLDHMYIEVHLGTELDFSDLAPIITFNDEDSPHFLSVSEGLFVETVSDTDIVSYTFDTTYIWKSDHI